MFSRTTLAGAGCFVLRTIVILALGCLAHSVTEAQHGGAGVDSTGTGGRHAIQGRIYFPSGRRSDSPVKVKLESYGSGELSVISDSNGSFGFTGLLAGNYTVVVEGGDDYETVREPVFIDTEGSNSNTRLPVVPRVYNVQISLMPKRVDSAKTGVLNAELAQVPDTARALYAKGVELSNAHEAAKAEETLKAAIALYPKFPLALNELGVVYLKMGQAKRAIEPLKSATKLSPNAFSPKLNLGIALLETQQFANAETQLRECVKISSTPIAHMYLGLVLAQLHEDVDAEKEFKNAIGSGGDQMAQAHKYLGGLYWRMGQYRQAADELDTYLRLTPNAADAERVRETIKQLRTRS